MHQRLAFHARLGLVGDLGLVQQPFLERQARGRADSLDCPQRRFAIGILTLSLAREAFHDSGRCRGRIDAELSRSSWPGAAANQRARELGGRRAYIALYLGVDET